LRNDFIALSRSWRRVILGRGGRDAGVKTMRKILSSALALAILSGPAFAQQSRDDDPIMIQERDKEQQAKALDKQYKRTLDQTRKENDARTRTDPWANMRGQNDGKR
jgi:hypothetical protein